MKTPVKTTGMTRTGAGISGLAAPPRRISGRSLAPTTKSSRRRQRLLAVPRNRGETSAGRGRDRVGGKISAEVKLACAPHATQAF